MTRQAQVADSIVACIISDRKPHHHTLFTRVRSFFLLYSLPLELVQGDLFLSLRSAWRISDDTYKSSFDADDTDVKVLESIGEYGYSGSTFFATSDTAYLAKSIPRRFEHSFFKNDLLQPYVEHMLCNPASHLCHIDDFLQCTQYSLGTLLGLVPTHHIIMENLMCSKGRDSSKWEHWDLKPLSYFFPERDVADGALSSEATKSRLADEFTGTILLDLDQAEDFKAQLEKDTAFLAKNNAVDYSLFLVRIPSDATSNGDDSTAGPSPQSWRTGIQSADGKHVYRAVILDFFWAKHKVHAKAMTGLINAYNIFDRKGPMSVTTNSSEYRGRFLQMCHGFIEVSPQENVPTR